MSFKFSNLTKIEKILIGLTVVGLGLNILQLIWAAIVWRPLIGDGGIWTFQIVNNSNFTADWQFHRYIDLIWQTPAVLYLNLFPNLNAAGAILINNLIYNLVPICLLLVSCFILKKINKSELIIFILFSYASITSTVIGRPFTMVPGTIAVVWLLFVLTLAYLQNNRFKVLFFIVCVSLCFAHESVVFCFLVLTIIMLYELKSSSMSIDKTKAKTLVIIFAVCSLWYIGQYPFLPLFGKNAFLNKMLTGAWDLFRSLQFILLILFLILLGANKLLAHKFANRLIVLFSIGVVGYYIHYLPQAQGGKLFNIVYLARTWAMALAALLMLACYYADKKQILHKLQSKNLFLGLILSSLSLNLLHEQKLTQAWLESAKFIQHQIATGVPCQQFDVVTTYENFYMHGFDIKLLPLVSLLYQVDQPAKVILFSEENLKLRQYQEIKNLCCPVLQNKIALYGNYLDIHEKWRFNLSSIQDYIKVNQKNMCE